MKASDWDEELDFRFRNAPNAQIPSLDEISVRLVEALLL